ncbi:ImmA/IrrE family metallo-endopeptidase [Sporolactobacillus vineae]|uniref:ImmA/IrrE family metallo-endopeptidase n=1 Tax=Sporolactobacillus vineae TaxID=444463 RepID=UPI00037450F8|nr:ImmA/IrrE family metallo-endopeptidase [Sporolactobacillus vineae]
MVKVEVSSAILEWAVGRVKSPEKLFADFPKLREWINQTSQPTINQLEKLAIKTYVPFGFMFLKEPPLEKLPIPHYRTVKNRNTNAPSSELMETVKTMETRKDWMHDYLIEVGNSRLDFVGSVTSEKSTQKVAEEIKKTLKLSSGWANECSSWESAFHLLLARTEKAGILVVINGIVGNNTRRPLNVDEFRGFVLIDDYAPLIFINGKDGKAAQMFTLAHELAHVWLGKSAAFDLKALHPSNNIIELKCNEIAAEFLAPENEFRYYWFTVTENHKYQQLAKHFKVSEIVIARRALDLDFITRDDFFDFYNHHFERLEQEKLNHKKQSGGNFYAVQNYRVGRRFAQAVITEAQEGNILYREAYRLTGLKSKAYTEFAKRIESEGI